MSQNERSDLKMQNLSDGTVYNRISALAQFFEYLRNEVGLMKLIPINPARVSLPKAEKPFQSESVKALSVEELGRLLDVVANHTNDNQPVYLRDYAILQFYVATGRRRAEIINLRGNSIEIKAADFLSKPGVKGGFFINSELPKTPYSRILKRLTEPVFSAKMSHCGDGTTRAQNQAKKD